MILGITYSHISIEQDKQSLEIRRYSRQCLNKIRSFGDQIVQGRVLASGYAGSLLSVISTASVIGSQNDQEIHSALLDIKEFLDVLHNGRQNDSYKSQPQFPPQTKLINQFNEQLEEEEGLEEIEAQVISQRYNQNFTDFSKETKSAVLNIFIFFKRLQSPPDSDSDDDDDDDERWLFDKYDDD
ncbi:MAG: hypothetical protein EZS28_036744 [Streblomastix strix]|uniref:Uncharacterized protein n=1 Tax=Streblomastix strix TaxID=222440 RepID=A0A5J4UC10_9EUKA|nr:MAG: hypothetical protein EZS28_036744 [Streblomastix strix]